MLRVLLVQIRKDAMKEHEYECIREKMGLEPQELHSFDIFERLIKPADLEGYDALVLGGSGAYCVSEKEVPREIASIEMVVVVARERGMPILGICFGHHLLAEAFGGRVEQDCERQEVGTFLVTRVGGEDDPLFCASPAAFLVQEGHKDHVTVLPPGAMLLASTHKSPNQVFTFPGEMIYGVQFHPELEKKDVLSRLTYYHDLYLSKKKQDATDAGSSQDTPFDAIVRNTQETPEASLLLRRFVRLLRT
jgi:GMP synthase (glutamine-hydrolysing)